MAFTEKELGQGRYNDTNNNTVYTVPASTTAMVTVINLCNTSLASATYRLFLVPSGGSADQTTALFYDATLGANETIPLNMRYILETGGTIQFRNGTANAITITISGIEIGT